MTRDPAAARYNTIAHYWRSPRSTVTVCTCGWRDVTTTRTTAHDLAGQHILDTSPAREKWLQYHGPRDWSRP